VAEHPLVVVLVGGVGEALEERLGDDRAE
jgi:hypothetical protein